MNFGFKNGYKNDLKDKNDKSCSWSRNRVSPKIDFKARWLRNVHADSVEVMRLNYVRGNFSRNWGIHSDPLKIAWSIILECDRIDKAPNGGTYLNIHIDVKTFHF